MKKIASSFFLLFTFYFSYSQNYKLSWGDEVKMKKNTKDMDIVAADKSGVYFTEERAKLQAIGLFGNTIGTSAKLVKFDKSFNEVFEKDYSKELKGVSFDNIQMLDDGLFLFATDYDKREKTVRILGAKLDKNTGEMLGELSELDNYQLESKRDNYDIHFDTIENTKNFLLVTDISNNDRTSIAVAVLDKNLKKKQSAVINLSYEKKTYSLEDVKFTQGGKIILLGKVMEHMVRNNGKQKNRMVFKEFALSVYNSKGKKEKDIDLSSGSHFIIGGKIIEEPNGQLLLAGFYSNEQKKNDLNGFFMNKIDVNAGTLTLSSFKEINSGMLGDVSEDADDAKAAEDDDNDKKSRKEKKKDDDDEEEELPNSYTIRSVNLNPADGSYIITSEITQLTSYTYSYMTGTGASAHWETRTVYTFTNRDILLIDADKEAQIRWLNVIPKYQVEQISSSGRGLSNSSAAGLGYFAWSGGMPYYSSFTSFIDNNKMFIILNDHEKNKDIAAYGNKVKMIRTFKKFSDTYGVSVDLNTGKLTKKFINENSEDIILMPRHSYTVGNTIYIPSMRQRMMAKSELKIAKIVVN